MDAPTSYSEVRPRFLREKPPKASQEVILPICQDFTLHNGKPGGEEEGGYLQLSSMLRPKLELRIIRMQDVFFWVLNGIALSRQLRSSPRPSPPSSSTCKRQNSSVTDPLPLHPTLATTGICMDAGRKRMVLGRSVWNANEIDPQVSADRSGVRPNGGDCYWDLGGADVHLECIAPHNGLDFGYGLPAHHILGHDARL